MLPLYERAPITTDLKFLLGLLSLVRDTPTTMSTITEEDTCAVAVIERVCSTFSLMGCLLVLVTFSCSDAFRQRAINRMVFYATFGNMLANVATLMTRDFIDDANSPGCQLQAFLIQV